MPTQRDRQSARHGVPNSMSPMEMAQALRQWEDTNPGTSAVTGSIPFLGQAQGIASGAATAMNPDAGLMDYGMAAAGVLPGGKALKALSKQEWLANLLRRSKKPEKDIHAESLSSMLPDESKADFHQGISQQVQELEEAYKMTGDEEFLKMADYWRRFESE